MDLGTYGTCERCGNPKELVKRLGDLTHGKVISCGCVQREAASTSLKGYHSKRRVSKGVAKGRYLTSLHKQLRSLTAPLHKAIMRRDHYRCVLCHDSRRRWLHVHHLSPLSHDLSRVADPTNLVTLCKGCHISEVHDGSRHSAQVNPQITKELQGYADSVEVLNPTSSKLDLIALQQEVSRIRNEYKETA